MTHLISKENGIPKTVSDLIADIESIESVKFPSIDSYLSVGDYFIQMHEGLKIVKKYQNGESSYDIALMNQDLLHLSAIHVSLGELIGYLQGWARFSEDQRKITKSDYAFKIKKQRDLLINSSDQSQNLKITESEIDNFSRVLAKDTYIQAADAEVISRMMSQAWYSMGDFIKVLNSSIGRLHQELYTRQ